MNEFESLETMAEIAVTLTGFTGVVSVFGARLNKRWTGPDRLFLLSLLNWSLIAVILGLLPGVLSHHFQDMGQLWVSALTLFACLHVISLGWFIISAANIGLAKLRQFEQRIIIATVPIGLLLGIAQWISILGPWSTSAALVYHLGILWYILCSSLAFSFMLFPRTESDSSERTH